MITEHWAGAKKAVDEYFAYKDCGPFCMKSMVVEDWLSKYSANQCQR